MKSKYNATSNCLEELATIGKPPILLEKFIEGTTEWLATKIRWDEYNAHLASLRRIPCHPSCVGKWSDGQILTEDVDYVVGDYPVKAMMSNDPKHLAFPLPVKSEDQDEVWASAMELYATAKNLYPFSPQKWFATVKEKYTLTKK